MKVWMNGELVDQQDAKISVFDHCLLYGDGVFEGIRIYNGTIFQCAAHMDRLLASAEAIRLEVPFSADEITDAMYQTLRANGLSDGYIRLLVTRGRGTLGLDLDKCSAGAVIIIADTIALYPSEMYESGLEVIVAERRRISADMLPPAVKSCNYLNNILAKADATDAGTGEAIMLNAEGQVAEATGDNVFLVKGGTVFTPPPEAGILIGVTRRVVVGLCGKLGISLEEKPISVAELRRADEVFLTGTAAEVIAVTKLDGQSIGSGKAGPVTRKLLEAFRRFIRDECG
jgi:branched-chain amino acid aminotransferase